MLASIPLFICTELVETCRVTFYIQNSSPPTKNKGGSGRQRFTIFSELRFARGSLTMRTATLARGPQPAQSWSRKVCVLAQRNLMANESSFILWQMIHSLLRHGFLKILKIQLHDTRDAEYDAVGIYKISAFTPTVRRDTQLGTRCRCL